jgi:tetratricopeptide (TPR) repeat protein
MGQAYVVAGRFPDALECGRRALGLAREHGRRPYEARALRLLGEVAAHRESPEQARDYYRQALTVAEELGMQPLVAHCHLGLARLHKGMARPQYAYEHLTIATASYRDLGMPHWLAQAQAEQD